MTHDEWQKHMEAALDEAPGTSLDNLFEDLETYEYCLANRDSETAADAEEYADKFIEKFPTDPEIHTTNRRKHLVERYQQKMDSADLSEKQMIEFGRMFAQLLAERNTKFLWKMAKEFEEYAAHTPAVHDLRKAILRICIPHDGAVFTIRHIVQRLLEMGFNSGDNAATPENFQRGVREQCKKLGITIKGKSGRPKN